MEPSVVRQSREALEQYGKSGDNTFECIGFTVVHNQVQNFKAYRLYQRNPLSKTALLPPQLQGAAEQFAELRTDDNARIFDISACQSREGTQWRFTLKFKKDISMEAHLQAVSHYSKLFQSEALTALPTAVDEIIRGRISPNRCSIIQLGAEVDQDGNVCAIKSYYSLRSNLVPKDYYFRLLTGQQLCPTLQDVWERCGCKKNCLDALLGYSKVLEGFDYHPFLLGINQTPSTVECKLYFLLQPFERYKNSLAQHSTAMLKAVGLPEISGNAAQCVAEEMDSLGLCLKGLAISDIQGESAWKIYYALKA